MFSELSLLSAQVLLLSALADVIVHVPPFFPSVLLGSFCLTFLLSRCLQCVSIAYRMKVRLPQTNI